MVETRAQAVQMLVRIGRQADAHSRHTRQLRGRHHNRQDAASHLLGEDGERGFRFTLSRYLPAGLAYDPIRRFQNRLSEDLAGPHLLSLAVPQAQTGHHGVRRVLLSDP